MTTCVSCGTLLPPEARFCPSCGATVSSPPPSEERKVATVLFADLVGSTQLGEQDPERTRLLLDRFYDAMAVEITAVGGTVEKFVGDAVMAVFGAPTAQEDHAERALHAALAMQRRLKVLFGERLVLRIGVNTGEVVVGQAREGSSFVTGDVVNVAARLEQAAGPGEILAGERTAAAAGAAFEFDDRMNVEAKGKAEGVECRRVVRALSLMRPRGVAGLRPTFVGREREFAVLEAAYRDVVERGDARRATIVGGAGVGKTRLVRELWERLGNESCPPWRRAGRCLAYGAGATYHPLAEVLREHFGILESDSPESVLRRLGGRQILGLTLGLELDSDLHPLAARDRLHGGWVEFLQMMVETRPLVLLVEDLHWAEEELLDLLGRLVEEVHGPLFLLGTARPELLGRRFGVVGASQRTTFISLDNLSSSDTEKLLEHSLGFELPGELRRLVVERSGGNPFFLEELVGTLIDQGVIGPDRSLATLDLPTAFALPDTVQGVLAARIDLLPQAEKQALQAAAVIGPTFWSGAVYELVSPLQPDLRLLEERDFVLRRSGSSLAGEQEYAIKHALTREVAYASLTKAKRARHHAAFATWLERVGQRGNEHAGLLAHHYARAVLAEDVDLVWTEEPERAAHLRKLAVHWLRAAATLAVGRYELDEAIALLQDGLELADDASLRARLWREIGHAQALQFDGEAFWTAMQNGLELTDDAQTSAELYSELAFQTTARTGMWKRVPAGELVDEWISRALRLAQPGSRERAQALIARCYSDDPKSEELAAEACQIADRHGDAELRSYAFDAWSLTAFATRDYGEAWRRMERRLELVEQVSDPDHLADIYAGAANAALAAGKVGAALEMAAQHAQVTQALSPHHRLHGVAVWLELDELLGRWDSIRLRAAEAESIVAENADSSCIRKPRSLLVSALAFAHGQDPRHAAELERKADKLGMEAYGTVLGAPRIQLALTRSDTARLDELLASPPSVRKTNAFFLSAMAARLDALTTLGRRPEIEAEAPPLLQRGTYLEPFALRALGLAQEDAEQLAQAATAFDALGLSWHATATRAIPSVR
jgi:class 3 adenylate cyclase